MFLNHPVLSAPFATFLQKAQHLDMSPIAYRLMYDDNGPQWKKAQIMKAIARYLAFLYLVDRYPRLTLVPSSEIDQVWHYHILDTSKYMDDCVLLFGYIVHHFPYLGLQGAQDQQKQRKAYALTQVLLQKHFQGGLMEPTSAPADCEPIRWQMISGSMQGPWEGDGRSRPCVPLAMEEVFHYLN